MKKIILSLAVVMCGMSATAQEIVKTGLNFGPLPVIAYDADKGLQYGAILNIFNYGDGHNYPNYDSKLYLEASFFTKGSKLLQIQYDDKELIPGVRWSSTISANLDKAFDFYGFNGYQSYFEHEFIQAGKEGTSFLYEPFYRVDRKQIIIKSDFAGSITDHLKWKVGYHGLYMKEGKIDYDNINKGKTEEEAFPKTSTLYDHYRNWGLISDDEAEGGYVSSIRAGLEFDTRDKEGAPTRGIWAEGHIMAAPKWLGTTNPFYRYAVTLRQYFPIVDRDRLTFAYRLNYEGTLGDNAPYYILPYITVMGHDCDKDGMGGYRTVRGIMRDRVFGLDMATYTAEFRWRFLQFTAFNQNIGLGLSAFSDGTMVTRGRDMSFKGNESFRGTYEEYMSKGQAKDTPHITVGSGFRFIMNENFIIAAEYGTPITHFMKNSPLYNQDGTGAFYINLGYLF